MNETSATQPEAEKYQAKTPEKAWGFPRKGRVLRLKPKEVMPLEITPTERDKRIKEKYGTEPQTGLVERGVRFDGPEGPAWAVEAYIPISKTIRKIVKRAYGVRIDIPERIAGIIYLDLAPQQSIYPIKYRTIKTDWRTKSRLLARQPLDRLRTASQKDNLLDFFAFLHSINMGGPNNSPEEKKARVFTDILQNIFSERKELQEEFNELLAQGKGTELVIVDGHGGGKPEHIMGEQYYDTVKKGDYTVQRAGNRVFTKEIVEMYNDPKTYAAVIFHACNIEGVDVPVKDVPIIHPLGASTTGDSLLADVIPAYKNRSFIKTPEK